MKLEYSLYYIYFTYQQFNIYNYFYNLQSYNLYNFAETLTEIIKLQRIMIELIILNVFSGLISNCLQYLAYANDILGNNHPLFSLLSCRFRLFYVFQIRATTHCVPTGAR